MKLQRNPKNILANLVVNQGGQVLTKVPLKVQIPARFSDIGLAEVGVNTVVYGFFAIIDEATKEYAVQNINVMVELNPSSVGKVVIDEVEYYEFSFDANTVFIKNTNVVVSTDTLFLTFNEFYFKGKLPWYANYLDVGKLFDSSEEFTGSDVASTHEVIELIASMISRDRRDRSKDIRLVLKSLEELKSNPVAYVPLESVLYSVKSSVNKLTGSYFQDGITGVLVGKSGKPSNIEKLLRA